MEKTNSEFDEKASLRLIEEMILSVRKDIKDNGFFFLLYGWLVFICALSQFVMFKILNYPYHYVVWPVLMSVGGIISWIYNLRESRRYKVKTYTDEFMGYIWSAFGIMLFLILISMKKIGYQNSYVLIMMLYGIGTFISGGALRFKPLIIGGVACWLLAAISFYVNFSTVLLLMALSILISYIIPGYILKANYGRKDV